MDMDLVYGIDRMVMDIVIHIVLIAIVFHMKQNTSANKKELIMDVLTPLRTIKKIHHIFINKL
jgi:hypothetical protein